MRGSSARVERNKGGDGAQLGWVSRSLRIGAVPVQEGLCSALLWDCPSMPFIHLLFVGSVISVQPRRAVCGAQPRSWDLGTRLGPGTLEYILGWLLWFIFPHLRSKYIAVPAQLLSHDFCQSAAKQNAAAPSPSCSHPCSARCSWARGEPAAGWFGCVPTVVVRMWLWICAFGVRRVVWLQRSAEWELSVVPGGAPQRRVGEKRVAELRAGSAGCSGALRGGV